MACFGVLLVSLFSRRRPPTIFQSTRILELSITFLSPYPARVRALPHSFCLLPFPFFLTEANTIISPSFSRVCLEIIDTRASAPSLFPWLVLGSVPARGSHRRCVILCARFFSATLFWRETPRLTPCSFLPLSLPPFRPASTTHDFLLGRLPPSAPHGARRGAAGAWGAGVGALTLVPRWGQMRGCCPLPHTPLPPSTHTLPTGLARPHNLARRVGRQAGGRPRPGRRPGRARHGLFGGRGAGEGGAWGVGGRTLSWF